MLGLTSKPYYFYEPFRGNGFEDVGITPEFKNNNLTILYATHIFDGLDDWPTHLHYLTDSGNTGWEGKLEDLQYYQQLKEQKHPAKMLAVADHWLRKELERNRKARKYSE